MLWGVMPILSKPAPDERLHVVPPPWRIVVEPSSKRVAGFRFVLGGVTGYETEAIAFTACVRETATEQARCGAVAVGPPALVLVKLYGCNGGLM